MKISADAGTRTEIRRPSLVPDWDNMVPVWDSMVPDWDNMVPDRDNMSPDLDNMVLDCYNIVPDWDIMVLDWDNMVSDWENVVPDRDNMVPDWGNDLLFALLMSVMMFYEVKTKKEISHDIFLTLIFTNCGYYNGFIIFMYVLEKNSI
jgi:hypothetical protein